MSEEETVAPVAAKVAALLAEGEPAGDHFDDADRERVREVFDS